MSEKDVKSEELLKPISRRRFAKTFAAVAALGAPLGAASLAQAQTTTPKEPAAPPKPESSPTAPRTSPAAEAYLQLAFARFGGQFSAEQLTELKQDIEGIVRNSDRFKTTRLQNADEPDFVFTA